MQLKLGTNLGFAINKYIEPSQWTKIVREDLGIEYVQFVADLLNPFLPSDYIDAQIGEINRYCLEYDIKVESMFTSAFTRVNHLMNPDSEARKIWYEWFVRFLNIGSRLGAKSLGSHFGIMTFDTYYNESKASRIMEEGIKNWQKLSHVAKDLGYECLIFEPMSVPREMGTTVEETKHLLDEVNANCGVPMKVCLDIGHAPDPKERDPYPWIEQLANVSPVIHLQQTVLNKSNHWPFIPEYNKAGIIDARRVLNTIKKSGCRESFLAFEISHREHHDTDYRIVEDLAASAEYWRDEIAKFEREVTK